MHTGVRAGRVVPGLVAQAMGRGVSAFLSPEARTRALLYGVDLSRPVLGKKPQLARFDTLGHLQGLPRP